MDERIDKVKEILDVVEPARVAAAQAGFDLSKLLLGPRFAEAFGLSHGDVVAGLEVSIVEADQTRFQFV